MLQSEFSFHNVINGQFSRPHSVSHNNTFVDTTTPGTCRLISSLVAVVDDSMEWSSRGQFKASSSLIRVPSQPPIPENDIHQPLQIASIPSAGFQKKA